MNSDYYDLRFNSERAIYVFDSVGPQGSITKVVSFQPVEMPELAALSLSNVYNLGFGDYNSATGYVDDKVKSDNGDRDKVLITVATAALDFLEYKPDSVLFVTGSTPERTRLYQMGLNHYFSQIETSYNLWGRLGGTWQIFERKVNYDAFLCKKIA